MANFGKTSRQRLDECHPDLIAIAELAIIEYDFSVICGHRSEEDQHTAFITGRSQLDYPDSKHNSSPSMAMDIVPYPVDWDDITRFIELSNVISHEYRKLRANKKVTHDLIWGGDWKSFKDYPHWELR